MLGCMGNNVEAVKGNGMTTIKHQDYYGWHPTGVECKDIAEHFNFNLGMAIKYIWRAGRKTNSSIEDLQKAITCLEFEIEKIKKFDDK